MAKLQGKPEQPSMTSLRRIWDAFIFSLDGLRHILRSEAAFKQQVALGIVLIGLAFFLTADTFERSLLIFPILLSWVIEILNTAIEAAADAVSAEFDANIKIAKDCGSLAVLVGFFIVVTVWAGVLL